MSDTQIDVYEYSNDLQKAWWILLVSGLISVGIGGFLIFSPGATVSVITAIIGIFMIVAGVVRFFVAIFDRHASERWLMLFAAIIGIVLGVVVMKNPEATIAVLVLVVAVYWLISGLVELARGITNSDSPDRALRIVFGLMSAILAVVILVWPAVTVGVFAVISGIYAVFFGVLEIIAAFQIKNA